MEILDQCLTLAQFGEYVKTYYFGTQPANKLVIHHTWRPTKAGWAGERTIQGLKRYYEQKGWSAGPHLFVAEDGIWLFSPMRKDGIHAGELNHRSVGIEVVGDYDAEVWSGQTKTNALGAIAALTEKLGIPNDQIFFHHDVSAKSCPGSAITKPWLWAELEKFRGNPSPTPAPGSELPEWAKEAVTFVTQNRLFEIRTQDDVRDAVKFHRFYQFIDQQFE